MEKGPDPFERRLLDPDKLAEEITDFYGINDPEPPTEKVEDEEALLDQESLQREVETHFPILEGTIDLSFEDDVAPGLPPDKDAPPKEPEDG